MTEELLDRSEIGYIYCITNKINGKKYIGQTVEPKSRFSSHKGHAKRYKGLTSALPLAIKKYGAINFDYEIIDCCAYSKLNNMEMAWVAKLDTFNNGYNNTLGGGGSKGHIKSVEQRAQISKVNKGKIISEQTRAAISKTAKENPRIQSPEERKGTSDRLKTYWDKWHNGETEERKIRKPYAPSFGENIRKHRLEEAELYKRHFTIIDKELKPYPNGKKYWWLKVECDICKIVRSRSEGKHNKVNGIMTCRNCIKENKKCQ
jgi:group I intron endonuclease